MRLVPAVWRHKTLQNLSTVKPIVGTGAFIAPSATLVGDVSIGEKANVWYGAVLRGEPVAPLVQLHCSTPDIAQSISELKWQLARLRLWWSATATEAAGVGDAAKVSVGDHTNLQDGVLVRTLRASPEGRKIGTTIGSRVTVGHGAVLNGVTVEDEAFIGIGAVLQEGVKVE